MRDWRLYDQRGTRYTDFYQYDGAAFLGHRPESVARVVAAEIDRGLWSAVPTAWPARLEKALAALARFAGVEQLVPVTPGAASGATPSRWYPLSGEAESVVSTRAASVVLPFPVPLNLSPGEPLPPPDQLSVVLLAGLVRASWSLYRYLERQEAVQRLELAETLSVPPGYYRAGVYFVADGAVEEGVHRRRLEAAWKRAIVLPPHPWVPLTVPGELGRVESQSWEALCRDWPQ